jgi:hypothetical protein
MAAPSAGTRPSPAGIRLDDGLSTVIGLKSSPTVGLWQKSVTPPGWDGGSPVATGTMHNVTYDTQAPRKLKKQTDATFKCAYDPKVMDDIIACVNRKDTVTTFFPDGSTQAAFGFVKEFKPDAAEEGKQPEATVTICFTNCDPVTGAEQGPVYVDVAGT